MPPHLLSLRRFFPFLLFLLVALAGTLPVAATTYQRMADASLADQASVIVEGRVAAVEPAPAASGTNTDYLIDIDRLLKGHTAGSTIVVRVLGGVNPGGMSLKIWGAPVFLAGEHALLFLKERQDGSYGILHLMLGAFHELDVSDGAGRKLALRDLSEAEEVVPPRPGVPRSRATIVPGADQPRDASRFADWLADRASGGRRPADYLMPSSNAAAGVALQALRQKFTLFTDPNNGNNLRWFDFDSGSPVTFMADSKGQAGIPDGGFAEFQVALSAWTNNTGTPIRYLYGGKTSAKGGLKNFDNTNAILFADPNDEISGTFDCSSGGTLAVGGPWYDSGTTATFNGKTYAEIQGGDVIVNNGLDCFFARSATPDKAAEELFAHELGHTLGLGHSSESKSEPNATLKDALMFAYVHDDGRGARFNIDDLQAIHTLYAPNTPLPSSGVCQANDQTLCLLGGRFAVQLSWLNQFDSSTGVGRAVPATDVTGYFSFGDPANLELLIKILDFGSAIKVFYGELTNLHFTVTVTDVQTGRVKTYANTSGDCGGIDQNFAAGATAASASALAVLQDPAAGHLGRFRGVTLADLASLSAGASGTCRANATTLCLLDNRFAVQVAWRNPGNNTSGSGGPHALSNFVGTFYFTDPSNVELMTKVIPFNDRVVFFYGALSDLVYTIQVTDTVNGRVNQYQSTSGKLCGGLDNSAFAP